jgi:hypothetical protein
MILRGNKPAAPTGQCWGAAHSGLGFVLKAILNIAQMGHKAKWRMSSKRGEVCSGGAESGQKKPHRSSRPVRFTRRVIQLFGYFFKLTLIDFGLASSALGRVSVNTPFSNSALALSATTLTGRVSVRWNAPKRRSLRR